MGRVTISDVILTDVADAIREKTKTSDTISPLNFADMIMSIVGGSEGGSSSSDYFFQEYSSSNNININSRNEYIDIDYDDVEWLIIIPMQINSGGQYAFTGGVYIPNVFGRTERTSYGVSTFSIIGCGSGSEITVSDGVITLTKGQNCTIYADIPYGIIGKAKS